MGLFKKKEEPKSKFYFREVPKQPLGGMNIFLIALMVLVGIFTLFFISTYLRWNNDISNFNKVVAFRENEKIVYNNEKKETFEVLEVKDFYSSKYDLKLENNEAAVLYCGSRRTDASKCYYINPSDGLENTFRSPLAVVCVIVALELFLLFIILTSREKKNKLFSNIFGGCIILVSGILLGMQIFGIMNYYFFVNGNENIVNGKVIKEIKDSKKNDKFLPLIEYTIDDEVYTYVGRTTTDKKVNDEITLYYKSKDYNYVTEKRNPINVFNIVGILCLLVVGIMYTLLTRFKILKKESNEE